MFCSHCGADNSADSKYCKECGSFIAPASSITLTPNPQDFAGVEDPIRQERLTKLLDMAFWHNDVGNLDAAVLAAEAALTINPDSTTAHSLLGTLYEKKGNDDKAIAHLEAVLDLNPDSAADAAKLEMLHRGVRTTAVAPPAGFRWIPPALAGTGLGSVVGRVADISERAAASTASTGASGGFSEKIASWNLNERKIGGLQMMPVLYSGAAAIAVFAICFGVIRSSRSASATPERVVSVNVPPSSAASSAFANPSRGVTSPFAATPNPLSIASNVPTSPDALRPPFTAKTLESTPDPFTERLTSTAGTTPLAPRRSTATPLPQRPYSPRVASRYGSEPGQLPPLQLHAVPVGSNGMLAPAPVYAPAISATVDPINRHTVVVPALGSGGDGSSVASNGGQDSGGVQPSSGGTPIIRITVHDSSDSSDSSSLSRSTASGGSSNSGGGGDGLQQTALSLQSQGNYRAARTAYEKAIRTYKADIAAGRNQESAQRGLQACQTGLQICQQSE